MDVQVGLYLLHGCAVWFGSDAWKYRLAWICCMNMQHEYAVWLRSVAWMCSLA